PRSSVQKTLTLGPGLEYNELLTPPPQTRSPAEAPQMAAATTASPQSDSSESGKLPRWAFYSGVAVTGALVAVTIWSGVDTLNAKDGLPSRRDPGYAAAVDDVHGSARRTDWLLGGSFAAAAATAIVGIWDTDWNHSSAPRVGLAPGKTGAQLRIQGGFW
ncbi:MAG TPA: hypothetical protein VL137_06670, partial [Polyangiaceae bacterium]|nr:hypothetical protein [Polyangiaceae bacterium]